MIAQQFPSVNPVFVLKETFLFLLNFMLHKRHKRDILVVTQERSVNTWPVTIWPKK